MVHILRFTLIRQLHSANRLEAGGVFRARRRLPPSNNEWGPLTDLPDYTVIGKANPQFTSEGQRRRAIRQFNVATKIIQLVGEMNKTQAKYAENKEFEKIDIESLQDNRLREKGNKIA
ncbi:39S ribosomal protein L52 [Schistosoma japonicum]|uniref:Large ribosomal subunit protein mL52 n=1 Tax=Schistosoma japonicum TaxID=6182 RepID=Q5DAI7_SCHJA|nr:SJCHGC09519 protein [Schistosoma japonicum]KAH8873193.1 39S ribosomal protein L52, mitochondrial [Schistosoma japonicum]TNN17042.1 39S ribosomal protein L52 [Schistosoma japonicum]CAX74393.1 hypothetical protein [Schistosoma japonicum]CAX74394.1 hypothetical protein [Schistosoma japonicum]